MVNLFTAALLALTLGPQSETSVEDERQTVRLPDSFFHGDLTGGVEGPARLPYQFSPGHRIVITPGVWTSLPRYHGPLEPGPVRRGSDVQPPGEWRHPRERSQE